MADTAQHEGKRHPHDRGDGQVWSRRDVVIAAREKLSMYLADGGGPGKGIKIRVRYGEKTENVYGILQAIIQGPYDPELQLEGGPWRLLLTDGQSIRLRLVENIWFSLRGQRRAPPLDEVAGRDGFGEEYAEGEVSDVEEEDEPQEDVPRIWVVEKGDFVVVVTKDGQNFTGRFDGTYDEHGTLIEMAVEGRHVDPDSLQILCPAPGSVRF